MNDLSAFICCGGGLYHLQNDQLSLVRKGISYGLTYHKGFYYLFERLNRKHGQLWRFKWENNQALEWKVIFKRLTGGVHQIDFIGDSLYVVDSYQNAIFVMGPRGWVKKRLYPRGKLENGRESPNYVHFNSVFATQDRIYLLAHNEGIKTGKTSDILVFDRDSLQELEVISDRGQCAHNVLIHDDLFLSCDSISGTITDHGEPVMDIGQYTRGLALNDEALLVGGSVYSARGERLSQDCFVYIADREFNLLQTIKIEGGGQTHEIRMIGTDYGLSNTSHR